MNYDIEKNDPPFFFKEILNYTVMWFKNSQKR